MPEDLNVLYVDDEVANLTAFQAAFRRNFNVFTAESGREAIEVLRKHPIKVIITDQRMPEMTGIQFLEAIIPEYPDTIRMILTGFSDIESIIKAINTGRVYRYITKPWDENELKFIIESGFKVYELEEKNKKLLTQINEELMKHKRVMGLFQRYVPENVLNEILANNTEAAIIHGEFRIISVMFADIRDFTSITTRLEPRMTISLLNDYFSLMASIIQKNKGSLNKFIGDGLLAIFGAPLSYIDNQHNAVMCAIEMVNALDELNAKYEEKLGTKICIGVGINTGEVVVGNIGSTEHIEYTAIGDAVNIASRIENITKDYPNGIIISENTYNVVKNEVVVEELQPQMIKGKPEMLKLFKVIKKA